MLSKKKYSSGQKKRSDTKRNPGNKTNVPAKFSLHRREVKIKVSGFNRARLLSALTREGICVKEVMNITSEQFILTIHQKEYAKTFAICERLCYNCNVVEYIGLICWAKSKLNRIGLVAGALATLLLFSLFNAFLLDVKITGTESIAKTELLTYLKNNGVKAGVWVNTVNRDYVKQVVNSFDGVAECSVQIIGHTLYVRVTERDNTTPQPPSAQNLCSRFDATVTRVVCENGTAKVRVGQTVKTGDVLIEGKLYDQNNQTLTEIPARGKVYGKVTHKRVFVTTSTAYELVRTGRSKAVSQLQLWGITIGKASSPFTNFESERTQSVLPLLPIKAVRTVYYETQMQKTERTLDEMVEKCTQIAQSEYVDDVNEGIETKTYVRELTQTEYEITVYITTEREIT